MNSITQCLAICFIALFLTSDILAQCPNPNATLSFGVQQNVNDFLDNYPNCTTLDKDLSIGYSASGPSGPGPTDVYPITSLSGFQNLEVINGTLEMQGPPGFWSGINYSVNGIGGMTNLRHVHTLLIDDLPSLGSVSFPALETVNKLILKDLPSLRGINVALAGLTVLDTIILDNVGGEDDFYLNNINFPESMASIELIECTIAEEGFAVFNTVDEVQKLVVKKSRIIDIDSQVDLLVHDVTLGDNESLVDISGLNFPEEMENIHYYNNPILSTGVEDFLNVKKANGYLQFKETDDVSFFANMEYIGSLIASGTENVTDLSVFQSIQTIGDMQISKLPDLTDLQVFSGADFIGFLISISSCGLSNLNDLDIVDYEKTYSVSLSNLENLTDVSFLSGVKYLQNMQLTNCMALDNLVGLQDLSEVSNQLALSVLPSLESISDLSSLEKVSILTFRDLVLPNLDGLQSLKVVDQTFSISYLNNLENLNELAGIEYIGTRFNADGRYNSFFVDNNPMLNSINALSDVRGFIGTSFYIFNNPLLDQCSLDYVCSNISHGEANINITDNGVDCDTEEKVIDLCGFNFMEIFLDKNGDGIQDADEPNISIGEIKVGDDFLFHPNNQGRVGFYLQDNPGYIEYVLEENWEVTTDNAYTATPDLLVVPDLIKIGIKGIANFVDANSYLSFNQIVCDREYDIYAIIKNEGTEPIDGSIRFTAPGSYNAVWPFPTDTSNNEMYFEFGEILPGQFAEGIVSYTAPSVLDIDLNTILELNYTTEITDQVGDITQQEGKYEVLFLCAYDPNDKQVFPAGVYDEHYTLFEDNEFEYLIRFQNTGNFHAQDITIRDTLDQNLDPSSFEFINASHEVSRIILNDHNLAFDFKNIFLPDSISNEPESHGFVHFKIKTKENLPENTRIENTGHIYFDFNPAIVTNTVHNTMVSVIPTSSTSQQFIQPDFSLYPNPTSGELLLQAGDDLVGRQYEILAITGAKVLSGVVQGKETMVDLSELGAGVYFVRVGSGVRRVVVE